MSVDDTKVRDEQVQRIAALSGAASVIAYVIGSSLAEHGGKGLDPTQSAETLGVEFGRLTGEARAGAAAMSASVALGLIFLGPLWNRVARGATWLAVVAVAGGVAAAALQLVTVMLTIGAMTAGDVGDGQTARTLLILEWETSRAAVAPGLAMVAAATLAGVRYGVFSRGFSAFGLVLTLVLLVALLPIGPAGLLGSTGALWVFVASLVIAFGRAPGT